MRPMGKHRLLSRIILTIKLSKLSYDDEFLEWFIKNPTCEGVLLLKIPYFDESGDSYKIITPKLKQKQILSEMMREDGKLLGKNPEELYKWIEENL